MSLRKQSILYVTIGVVQFLVDWGVMVLLSDPKLGWMGVETANIFGRIVGACLGFFLNGLLTFKSEHTKVGGKQFGKFVLMWILCTIISTVSIHYIDDHFGLSAAQWCKPLVEFVTGGIGFLLSRYWVYHK